MKARYYIVVNSAQNTAGVVANTPEELCRQISSSKLGIYSSDNILIFDGYDSETIDAYIKEYGLIQVEKYPELKVLGLLKQQQPKKQQKNFHPRRTLCLLSVNNEKERHQALAVLESMGYLWVSGHLPTSQKFNFDYPYISIPVEKEEGIAYYPWASAEPIYPIISYAEFEEDAEKLFSPYQQALSL